MRIGRRLAWRRLRRTRQQRFIFGWGYRGICSIGEIDVGVYLWESGDLLRMDVVGESPTGKVEDLFSERN